MIINTRGLTAAALNLLLVGCAANPETLAQYGEYELAGSNIKSFTVRHAEPAALGKLPLCIASQVRNDAVVLTNDNVTVGQYTGNLYTSTNSVAVGGGSVIQFVSPDGTEVVARGESKHIAAAIVERSVRFTLTAKDDGAERVYRFTGIEQAGTNNGYGYHPVHVMTGGGSGHVLGALKSLAADIDSCQR